MLDAISVNIVMRGGREARPKHILEFERVKKDAT